jgi:hypothetical protein
VVEARGRPRRWGGDTDRRRHSSREQRGTSEGARTATGVAENREEFDAEEISNLGGVVRG